MTSLMKRRTILPLLLALAVLAVLVNWQPAPAAAQGTGLAPPTVNLTAASSCRPNNPRTYLVVTYGSVADAASYRYRVKWGSAVDFDEWRAVPSGVKPGKAWTPNNGRYLLPGEEYAVEVRALHADGGEGEVGAGQFSYELGDASAPADVRVAYTPNGGSVDYTRARLTWQGNEGSGGWFSVQQRATGGEWQSGGWQQFSQLDGDESHYFHDVSELDPAKGHVFRVTGHTASCQPSAWSDGASLWPTLPAVSSDDVHEADGRWWRQPEDGPVSFKITWKGATYIRWKHWVEGPVNSWAVTASDSRNNTKTNVPKNAQREVRYGNLTFGEDYRVVVKALDADGAQVGVARTVVIRPRHISPPEAVTGLALSVGDDRLSVAADWTAPATGGLPKRYAVWLTNTDTGRAQGKLIELKQRRGGEATLKTDTVFVGLWPGDTYRVSVQTRTQNSRSTAGAGHAGSWQESEWTHATVTMPAGSDPAYDKKAPTLVWTPVRAGETEPPYVIGNPTAYVVRDHSVPGGYARFDAPNRCREYRDPHSFFLHEDNDAGAKAAILAAERQERLFVNPAKSDLAAAKAAKQKYLDDTPVAERSQAKVAELDADIARKQEEVDATERNLADLVTKLATACAAAYPVEENLTEADDRWYQAAQTRETGPTER